MPQSDAKVRTTDLLEMKRRGRKIAVLTAYDATMAGLLDRAGIDVLLVGDSAGMVVMGHDTTVPVTLEAMIHHAARWSAARGAPWWWPTCRFLRTSPVLPTRFAMPGA